MYNHYQGNSGRVRRVDDARTGPPSRPAQPSTQPPPRPSPPPGRRPHPAQRPPSPPFGLSGAWPGILSRIHLDNDDLLMLLILFLMYRESRDDELLWIMAALLFV